MDQIGQLIGIVAEPAYNLAIKHINYVACVSRLIKKLKEKRDKLNDKKDEIELRVERASGEGKVIITQVNKWLEQVSRCIDNVDQFLDEEKRITDDNKSGFHQCCCFIPNHHKTGKQAENLTTTLNELLEEAKEACFSDVGVPPPPSSPPEMALPPTAYSKEFDSRESLLEKIIEALKVHDTIGIYGMAGVGKTVLVERLVVEVKSRNLFDKVGMAVVSKNPSRTDIQNETADRILGHDKELHAKSEVGKKDWLHEELKKLKQQQKKVLLVLDDAWEPLAMHDVGIPCPNKDFKIVVTSRFRHVCVQMGAEKSFEVSVLKDREAWNLFRQSLGRSSNVLDSGEGYKDVAEEMIRHFKGLPLAIVTLAGALIDESLPTWRAAAKYLNERHLSKIEGMSEKVIGAVEFSFYYLRDRDSQIIFLLCCLFPEDWSIELNVLMKYGIGLGLFVDGLSHTMDRIVDITEKLKSRSLLLKGDKDGEVKMHDVTRDVALHIASEGEYGYLVKEDKEGRMGNVASSNIGKLKEKHAISVLTTKTNPIEFSGRDEKEYPDLHILRLQNIKEEWDDPMPIEFPTCFFERIGNLKILEICGMTIDTSTSCSLGCLKKNLRTLCLYNCQVIDIAEIGELTNLEILDLRRSKIRRGLYGAVQRLSRLRVLDLTNCSVEGLADNFVGGLPADQLEGLYLWNVWIKNHDRFMTCLAELEVLTHLEVLEVVVRSLDPVTDKFLSIFGKLSSFNIRFGRFDMGWKETSGPSDKVLHFYKITMKKHLQQGLGHLLRAANKLYLEDCRDAPIMSQYNYEDEFSNLTYLSIEKCYAAEDFVISGRRTMKSAESIHDDGLTPPFAKLEHLDIEDMAGLRAVCAPNQHIVLSKLKLLSIRSCPLLRYVFTKSVAIQLQQLQTMVISGCEEMKEIIFTSSRDNDYTSTTGISSSSKEEGTTNNCYEIMDDTHSINLPSLQKMTLLGLPHLKHFVARNTSPSGGGQSTLFREQVKFPELKNLRLQQLDLCEKIWESHLPTGSFGQLRELKISICDELRYIFSSAVARGLVQLEDLDIYGCSKLEEVVVMESVNDNEEENNITFPRLHSLYLDDLPHLKHFAARNTSPSGGEQSTLFREQVKFPELKNLTLRQLDSWESHLPAGSFGQLRDLKIWICDELRYIFSAAVARGLVQLEGLDIQWCSKLEEVVVMESVNGNEEENNITFPRLHNLYLDDLPHLKHFAARNTSPSGVDRSTFFGEQVKFPELKNLTLRQLDSCEKIWESHLPTGSLGQLRELNIWNCDELRYIFSAAVARGLVQLENLDIQWCSKLEEVVVMESVNDNEEENNITFPRLQRLYLHDLPHLTQFAARNTSPSGADRSTFFREQVKFPELKNLTLQQLDSCEKIWESHLPAGSFGQLRKLNIWNCDELRYIFSAAVARGLVQLESLDIQWCSKLEEVVVMESVNDNEEENNITFPRLHRLYLDNLPHLTQFAPRNTSPSGADRSTFFREQVKFPELKNLTLQQLDSCKKIWERHLPSGSFRQLRELIIWNCDELRYIFSAAVARGLVQLEDLDIQRCSKLEEVVVMESVNDNEEQNNTTFPRLHKLKLYHLDNLCSFCSARNSVLEFASLEEIEIEKNSNMQVFSYGSLHTPKLTGRALLYRDDLNAFVARMSEEIKVLHTSASDSELSVDMQPLLWKKTIRIQEL